MTVPRTDERMAQDGGAGPRARDLIARDEAVMSPSLTRPYPFVMASGSGAWVRDVDGVEYLDFTAGIAVTNTGHAHPRVVAAVQEQAARFLHMAGTDFYYEVEIALAERLARIAPVRGRPRVFFGNSGTEVIEGAIKLARYATGRPNLLAFTGAFHGRTLGALSLTASKAVQRDGFGPLLSGVFHAPYPGAERKDTAATIAAIERLEERGIVRGYRVVVDPAPLGFGLGAFVAVTQASGYHWEELERGFAAMPEVEECHSVTGDDSYLLKVRVSAPAALEALLRHINTVEGVARTRTVLILSTTFDRRRVR